ncbi:hypothetical protein KCTC52924_03016 [Arenibacter antarcticus]|uniref:Phage integrase SAM-like domain-containing protein n=1 Tax=Arenibacter antarcticus TaxID=2040469 RepID=A0ABW5VGN4_9FLAO|nr:hypothetical protein [Arenibacter sp. H213]
MVDNGIKGFKGGGMKAKKYRFIAKTSKATATRDLQNLDYELNLKKAKLH